MLSPSLRSSHLHRRAWTSAFLAVAFGCETTEPDARTLTLGSPVEIVEVLARRTEQLDDSLGFAIPTDIRIIPGGYVVADPRLDRLATLDGALEVRSVIGRTGSGPGEFRFPRYLSSRPGTFAVKEEGNDRVSLFDDRTLALKRSFSIPYSGEFALLDEENVLILAPDSGAVGAVFSADTAVLLEAPTNLPRMAPNSDTRSVARSLADVQDSLAYVLDEQTGAVFVYDIGGANLVETMMFPETLWAPLLEATADQIEGLTDAGVQVRGGDFSVKRMLAAGPGRVLVLIYADDAYGLLVDRDTKTVHQLMLPEDSGLAGALSRSTSGVVAGDTLVLISEMEVVKVRLGPVGR